MSFLAIFSKQMTLALCLASALFLSFQVQQVAAAGLKPKQCQYYKGPKDYPKPAPWEETKNPNVPLIEFHKASPNHFDLTNDGVTWVVSFDWKSNPVKISMSSTIWNSFGESRQHHHHMIIVSFKRKPIPGQIIPGRVAYLWLNDGDKCQGQDDFVPLWDYEEMDRVTLLTLNGN